MRHALPALLFLAACPDPDLGGGVVKLRPEITLSTDAITFGDVGVPLTVEQTFRISNGGRADLDVSLKLEGEGAEAYTLPVRQAELGPDDAIDLVVRFAPPTFLPYDATIRITSNDVETPEILLPVTGVGVSAPLPDIDLSSGTLEFVDVTTSAQLMVDLRNAGTAPLDVGAVRLEGSGAFQLLADPSNVTVAPGNAWPMFIVYTPTQPDGDSGRVVIPSNDPDEPEVTLVLLGNGGADYEYPVAVIDCPGPVDPPRFVNLDGSDSYDPLGLTPLSYTWTLVERPTDPFGEPISDGYLSSFAGPTTTLFADAVGTYVVDLAVTNAIGTRSAPTRCVVEAIPDELIVVELTWDTERADLDLHLAESGTELFDRGDATWCNPRPDWGTPNDASDDPRLDLDDRAGFGPENISIDLPAAGDYDVRVHYWDDHRDSVVTATVRVYLNGSTTPAFQASRLMSHTDVWDAARVQWPAATVAALSAPPYQVSDQRQCP